MPSREAVKEGRLCRSGPYLRPARVHTICVNNLNMYGYHHRLSQRAAVAKYRSTPCSRVICRPRRRKRAERRGENEVVQTGKNQMESFFTPTSSCSCRGGTSLRSAGGDQRGFQKRVPARWSCSSLAADQADVPARCSALGRRTPPDWRCCSARALSSSISTAVTGLNEIISSMRSTCRFPFCFIPCCSLSSASPLRLPLYGALSASPIARRTSTPGHACDLLFISSPSFVVMYHGQRFGGYPLYNRLLFYSLHTSPMAISSFRIAMGTVAEDGKSPCRSQFWFSPRLRWDISRRPFTGSACCCAASRPSFPEVFRMLRRERN